jgi:hypothetical protein
MDRKELAQRYLAVPDMENIWLTLITGPIEKGASDGQTAYATDLVRALKAGIKSRSRAGTTSTRPKIKGKRRKNDVEPPQRTALEARAVELSVEKQNDAWRLFESVLEVIGPIAEIVKPLISANMVIGFLVFLQITTWLRGRTGPPSPRVGFPTMLTPERIATYEEIWRREESSIWDWLEERIALEGLIYPTSSVSTDDGSDRGALRKARAQRERSWRNRDEQAKLQEEGMSEWEIDNAIRVTEQRLQALKAALQKKRLKQRERRRSGKRP